LVALYTLFAENPLLVTMDAFRMIEAPSGTSGKAIILEVDEMWHFLKNTA
jgi:hypothetical protein